MKLTELQKQINDRLGEVEKDTASHLLWKVEYIVYDILQDYKKTCRLYITTYNGVIKITTLGCNDTIYIKLRKKLVSKEYTAWYGYETKYRVVNVEVIASDEYDSIEGFLKSADDAKKRKADAEKADAKAFEEALAKSNIDFKIFYNLVEQYKSLSFNSKEILSEKYAGNRYTYF